jgi:tetrahydromethanopterin S-methyltransferase subunit F
METASSGEARRRRQNADVMDQPVEMIEDPQQKIGRPRQLHTGVTRRDYVDIDKRK